MSGGWTAFSWRGEPIHDIDAWAQARGEPMVRVRETTTTLSVIGGQPRERVEVEIREMPRCFAQGLAVSEPFGGGRVSREILADDTGGV
jgi:hypothetical protein